MFSSGSSFEPPNKKRVLRLDVGQPSRLAPRVASEEVTRVALLRRPALPEDGRERGCAAVLRNGWASETQLLNS
jgi:hypothetical protein